MCSKHFDTLLIHAGRVKSGSNEPCVTPIYQTSSFLFDDSDHAARLFELTATGHIYTRLSNPTTDVLEQKIAALEGGTAAVAVSSGQASQSLRNAGLNPVPWNGQSCPSCHSFPCSRLIS